MLFRSAFSDLFLGLLPNLRAVVFNRYNRWDPQFQQFFSMESTTNTFENYTGVGPLGLFQQRGEGTDIALDDIHQLYDKKLTPVSYGLGVEHTREVLDDDKFGIFNRMGELLAASSTLSKEILAAAFMDGSHDTYTSADGSFIHAANHPIAGGASTGDNVLTTSSDLSQTSIQNAMTKLEDTVDDRGNPAPIFGNKVIVHRQKRYLINQLLKSTMDPTSPNDAINPLSMDNLSWTSNAYLTDQNAWYVWSDYAMQTEGWIWLTRQAFDLDHDINVQAQTAISVATERYTYGVIDWRGTVKSTGA